MNRDDWTLLTIAAAHSPVSPVQLQKALFLIGQSLPGDVGDHYYQFRPYNYGPFDGAVYRDTEKLVQDGLVEPVLAGAGWRAHSATASGGNRAEEIRTQLRSEAKEYLDRLVEWVQSQSFAGLLRAVYAAYPAYRANSVFQD